MFHASDFQRESYRIDEQIWEAMALRADESAIFCGVANNGAWIARALEIGVDVAVVAGDEATLARVADLGATPIRGSATMIPAREGAFDVAVAFHYLHEVDPGFHAQIVHELARVGRRVVIVEPSPPADPLGRRIAALYARAKREAGQFEQYQPIEHWRRLLAVVKADVSQSLFTFTRVPPREAVAETISLILGAMAMEDLPAEYLDELRALASRPDAQLLPLSRIVLVGTMPGEAAPRVETKFRPDVDLVSAAPAPPERVPIAQPIPPPQQAPQPVPSAPRVFGAEAFAGPGWQPSNVPRPPVPEPPAAPFGAPFAVPDDGAPFGGAGGAAPASGFGWSWEPPEEDEKP